MDAKFVWLVVLSEGGWAIGILDFGGLRAVGRRGVSGVVSSEQISLCL
jgi:hypothetical protein